MLTQKELKEKLHYNPVTGIFTRIVTVSANAKAGAIIGKNSRDRYLYVCINGTSYLVHRLAWLYITGSWPVNDIDHINHSTHDNRFINLRDVTRKENLRNASISKANNSGVTGVCWFTRDKVWQASIVIKEKQKSIGFFKDKFETICCRKSAENKYNYHENHGM